MHVRKRLSQHLGTVENIKQRNEAGAEGEANLEKVWFRIEKNLSTFTEKGKATAER